jgi:HEAT repeat protein
MQRGETRRWTLRAMAALALACCLLLSLALIAAVARPAIARDDKPPDYAGKPLAKWIEILRNSPDRALRLHARIAVGPYGPYAKTAVPALIEAMKDWRDPQDGVKTLADYGPSFIPDLVRALKRPEASVRAAMARALGRVRPRSADTIPALLAVLKDSSADVRAAAVRSLGRFSRLAVAAVPSFAEALKDKDETVRQAAAHALFKMGRKAEPAVPALIMALKDKDGWVQGWAAQALGKIGPAAKAAVPALIEQLRDSKGFHFAEALGRIDPGAKAVVRALMEVLEDSDDSVRRHAAEALAEAGAAAKAAVPLLIKAAKKNQQSAFFALGKIGPDARAAVPTLIEALRKAESLSYKYTIAEALGGIGPGAKAAIPPLLAIVRDWEMDLVREAAASAVFKIDPELAARERVPLSFPTTRLGKVPSVTLAARPALDDKQKKRIKALIARLADVKAPSFGLSDSVSGHAFAPLPERAHWDMELVPVQRLKSSDAFRALVDIGPDALPFLLDALDEKTPTRLTIDNRHTMGSLWLSGGMGGNPVNKREQRILAKKWQDDGDDIEDHLLDFYRVKVGDVCFVAIGQMVGREYQAVSYIPTAMVSIGSPVESKTLRDRMRARWASKDPAKELLESLLIDYATEGIFNGHTLNGWDEASRFQTEAAMRLLYYFPKETAPLIAARLRSLDVRSEASKEREVKNGVRTEEFIKAVSWCKAPAIQQALADIARRTNDSEIKEAATAAQRK